MYCYSKCSVYTPLGDVFNVSCRQSFLYLSLMDSLPRWSLPYLPNQLRIFSYYFIVFWRLNHTDFLTLVTFVYLIHWSWFFGIVFISTVLRTWGSPKQWWPETGCELLCASLMLRFVVATVFFELFPLSALPVDVRAKVVISFLANRAKGGGQPRIPSPGIPGILQMVVVSSSTILWIY